MNILGRLFKKQPKEFDTDIYSEYVDTLVFEGWIRTADKLFTDEKTPINPLVFHVFNFCYNGRKYEFKVNDNKRRLKFRKTDKYLTYLNSSTLDKCWFNGRKRVVYLWKPDDEQDDW